MRAEMIKFINNSYDEVRYHPQTSLKRVCLGAVSCALAYATFDLAKKSLVASHSIGLHMVLHGTPSSYIELGCILLALTACAVSSVKVAQTGYRLSVNTPTKQTMLSQ